MGESPDSKSPVGPLLKSMLVSGAGAALGAGAGYGARSLLRRAAANNLVTGGSKWIRYLPAAGGMGGMALGALIAFSQLAKDRARQKYVDREMGKEGSMLGTREGLLVEATVEVLTRELEKSAAPLPVALSTLGHLAKKKNLLAGRGLWNLPSRHRWRRVIYQASRGVSDPSKYDEAARSADLLADLAQARRSGDATKVREAVRAFKADAKSKRMETLTGYVSQGYRRTRSERNIPGEAAIIARALKTSPDLARLLMKSEIRATRLSNDLLNSLASRGLLTGRLKPSPALIERIRTMPVAPDATKLSSANLSLSGRDLHVICVTAHSFLKRAEDLGVLEKGAGASPVERRAAPASSTERAYAPGRNVRRNRTAPTSVPAPVDKRTGKPARPKRPKKTAPSPTPSKPVAPSPTLTTPPRRDPAAWALSRAEKALAAPTRITWSYGGDTKRKGTGALPSAGFRWSELNPWG